MCHDLHRRFRRATGDPPGPAVPPYAARRRFARRLPVHSGRSRKRRAPTPLHFQPIAHRGACGKTRVVPHNRWPGPEPAEMGVAKCVCCCRRTGARGRRNHWQDSRCGCRHRTYPGFGADAVNPLTTSAFDLPDRLAAKADPALIAGDEQHFAAIAESLEQSIADLSGPPRCRAQGARRHRPEGAGPGHGDPPADRSPAHPAPLRPGPVPRTHRQRGQPRARVHRTAWPHRQRGPPAAARLALPRG